MGRGPIYVLLLAGLLMLAQPGNAQSTTVITSPDRGTAALDRQLLRAVYTMRVRVWPDGAPARVFVLPDQNPLHEQFCREQLGTYPYVLRNTWDRMVFTGTGLAPITVRDEAEMKLKVKSTPGAVGYIGGARQSLIPSYVLELAALDQGAQGELQ